MIYKDGKPVKLHKDASDAQRAQVREVLDVSLNDRAPRGMFSLQARARLKGK